MSKPMTAAAFRRWLEKHQKMVFLTNSSRSCPIARYLGEGASVVEENYRPPGRQPPKKMLRLPVWARLFVGAFDNLGIPGIFDGRRALEVLLKSSYRRG